MKRKLCDSVIVTVIIQSLLLPCVVAQAKKHYGVQQMLTKPRWQSDFAWMSEAWVGNDEPYHRIRAGIDRTFTGQDMKQLGEYQRLAQQKPTDPQAQFRWGCFAVKLTENMDFTMIEKILDPVRAAMAHAPSPHAYDYDRLRFLTETNILYTPQHRALGKRLLARDPNDADVKYREAAILSTSPDPAERQLAIEYATNLMQVSSKSLNAHGLLGGIYYAAWQRSHSKADAEKAIAAYQQYLDLAPAGKSFRSDAALFIQILQKG